MIKANNPESKEKMSPCFDSTCENIKLCNLRQMKAILEYELLLWCLVARIFSKSTLFVGFEIIRGEELASLSQ